jgi:tRNA nucleotidyltransferase (CCA-adding enzyme)
MKRYLVGGAVRDRLLGLTPRERDWVVVGATPESMVAAGYRQVGRDFPVFLHPETAEEHALARTERKTGAGHQGFAVHADPSVTLEEDLIRRDFTLNALAEDADGRLIDPYGGAADLAARRFRHVSPAFAEDPLRVLRLARFMARLSPLGFTVAEETADLCHRLTAAGALRELSAERVWQETARALMESPRPSVYFETLRGLGGLDDWLPEVAALFGVPQRADYHPEVDTGIHTLMCVDYAAARGYPLEVRFSALTHDFGKALTPPAEGPSHRGHEARGVVPVEACCERLRVPRRCRDLAVLHCREHLLIHQVRQLRPATLLALLERLQGFRRGDLFERVCEAAESDARGRLGLEHCDYPQLDYLRAARAVAAAVPVPPLQAQGFEGAALGEALGRARTAALSEWKQAQAAA